MRVRPHRLRLFPDTCNDRPIPFLLQGELVIGQLYQDHGVWPLRL